VTTDPVAPTTALRTTTTTSTPAFSFDDSVPPPKLINTGTNYVAILKSLEAYGNWLAAHHPDPHLAEGFVAAGTHLSDSYVALLSTLRDKRQRLVETVGAPDTYRIISTTPDAISATIVQRLNGRRVVDGKNHIVREGRFRGLATYRALAVRVHKRWYLAATDVTGAPERLP
jgi:hypothetical protein